MANLFKRVKDFFVSSEENKNPSRDSNLPGTDEPKQNIGKKVFEKTGRIREGVGQSSTIGSNQFEPEPAEIPVKLHHGMKKRKNVVNVSSKSSPVKKNSSLSSKKNKFKQKGK